MNLEVIGFAAGILTTYSYVPQICQLYKTKSAKDINTTSVATLLCGLILWLIYGIVLGSVSITIVNSFCILCSCSILFAKWKYGGSNDS